MHIAYVSDLDAHDIHSWSGSTYRMWRGLEAAGAEIDLITPLELPHARWHWGKACLLRQFGLTYSYKYSPQVLRSYARQVEQKIALLPKRPDVIVGCGKPSVAYLNTEIPLAFVDDASFPAITKSHPARLTRASYRQTFAAEQLLLSRATLAVYASEWAASAARQVYDVDPSKVVAVPWGANLECDRSREDVERLINLRADDRLVILFSGVNWEGKRGALVLDAAKSLVKRGVPLELHILGCDPPLQVPNYVTVHGFVSKADPSGQARIDGLYRKAHLLFVPTKADAYGIVFAEAASFGVPSISTAVGGVSSVVFEGQNGHLLSLQADAEDYARLIREIWSDRSRYADLARQSFRIYEQRLNWRAFGCTVLGLLRKREGL